MTITDATALKKLLKALGFEVYRTSQGKVLLAERVRDNLIMDSGVAVGPEGDYGAEPQKLRITVTLGAQASHFPGSTQEALKAELGKLAAPFVERGYEESGSDERHMLDPSDPNQVLDTSHELRLDRCLEESELKLELGELLKTRRSSGDD